jgi:hypothetical protein
MSPRASRSCSSSVQSTAFSVDALVPKARQVYGRESLRRAYRAASAAAARRQLTALATWLERAERSCRCRRQCA